MPTEPDRDFFLLAAIAWAALRADLPPGGRGAAVATAVTREAAVCHLRFQAGDLAEVLERLRSLSREFLGVSLPAPGRGGTPDAARVLGTAADLFHRLKRAAGRGARAGVA